MGMMSPGILKPTTYGHCKIDSPVNVQCDFVFFPIGRQSPLDEVVDAVIDGFRLRMRNAQSPSLGGVNF